MILSLKFYVSVSLFAIAQLDGSIVNCINAETDRN